MERGLLVSTINFNLKDRITLDGALLLINCINKILNEKYKSEMVIKDILLYSAWFFYAIYVF